MKIRKLRVGSLGSIEQDEFLEVILDVLRDSGGCLRRHAVIQKIQRLYGDQFNGMDLEALSSQNPPKERWMHNVDWAKRKLVEKGLIRKPADVSHGLWELTDRAKYK